MDGKVRVSKIAPLRSKQLFAPFVFTGNCNAEMFKLYVKNIPIKELEFGDVLVMDNTNFHKTQKVKELVESVWAGTYSPDLNPIIASMV